MSYSVFRIQGIKTTGVLVGISKHNKDRISHTNYDIDKERTKDNITLIECDNYNKRFNDIVAPMKLEHEERMKTMRADRIKTFNQHINSAKNDVAFEMVFTSDNEFFHDMSKDEIKRWAEKSLDFVTKDLGIERKNILHAVVHMDEKTPHLHVVAVPLVNTYNKKQQKDVWSISRRQYINGKVQLSTMQDIYNKRMNDSGYKLERGEKGSDKEHTTKAEYQKKKLEKVKKEVIKAKSEISKIKDIKTNIEKDLEELDYKYKGIKSNIIAIKQIEYKKNRLTGTVSLKQNDFENLKGLAKQGVINASKIDELERKNNKLESEISYVGSKNTELWSENFNLKNKVLNLANKLNLLSKVFEVSTGKKSEDIFNSYEKANVLKQRNNKQIKDKKWEQEL